MASPPDRNKIRESRPRSAERTKSKGRQTMTKAVFLVAGLAGFTATAAFASEYPVTPDEEKYCDVDYRQYCNQDGLGSQLLKLCMQQHGKSLSDDCIKALEAAGEVTPDEKEELKKIGE
jgi:hypothetical protein